MDSINLNGNCVKGRLATGLFFALAITSIGCVVPNVSYAAIGSVAKPNLIPICGGDVIHVASAARVAHQQAFTQFGAKVLPPSVIVGEFGSSQQEVAQHFAGVIESHFNSDGAEHTLNGLTDAELSHLARRYQEQAGAGNTRLLAIFATRLSDQALLRVASAFGKNAVTQAVEQNASSAVKASFLAKSYSVMALMTAQPDAPIGGGLPPPPPPSTDWTNTLDEIYLDYRTSSLGMGIAESLSATVIYSTGAVAGAWAAGTEIGSGVSYLITNYDPTLSDAIGGTVAGIINQGNTATTELLQGHLQNSFDSLFDLPITNSTDPSGPYNLTSPMQLYYDTYGPPEGDPGYDGGAGGGCE